MAASVTRLLVEAGIGSDRQVEEQNARLLQHRAPCRSQQRVGEVARLTWRQLLEIEGERVPTPAVAIHASSRRRVVEIHPPGRTRTAWSSRAPAYGPAGSAG